MKQHDLSVSKRMATLAAASVRALATGLAAVLAVGHTQAQEASRDTWVASAALGRSDYSVDCVGPFACATPRASAIKFGAGRQFGSLGVEVWWIDFGRSQVFDTFGLGGSGERVRMQAAVLDASWRWRFAQHFDVTVRAGVAQVRHQRTGDPSTNTVSPHLGVGFAADLTPTLAFEVAWDSTRGRRGDNINATVSANTLGLRLRF